MAAKKKTAKKSVKRKAATKASSGSVTDRILDAGLDEAGLIGWRNVTMDAIADRAGLALGQVLIDVPSKVQFALKLIDRVDAQTLQPVKRIDPADSPRDRLFEIMMRRFDALNAHRDGFKSIIFASLRDPAAVPLVLCRLHTSAASILSAAGISPDGILGLMRVKGLAVVGACALRAWLRDDSADLAKTMAALDKALARAEKLAKLSPFRRSKRTEGAAAA